MKIDRQETCFVITLPDKGANERIEFLSALRGVIFREWQDKNTPIYDTTLFSISATGNTCAAMKFIAERMGFEITPSANELFEEIALKHAEWYDTVRKTEEYKKARERAFMRVKYGCGLCEYLSWNNREYVCKKNNKPCSISNDEVELIFEEWKETKILRRPTPFPNKECDELEVLR